MILSSISPRIPPRVLPRDPHLGLVSHPATQHLAELAVKVLPAFLPPHGSPEAYCKLSWAWPLGTGHLAIPRQAGFSVLCPQAM